MGGVYRVGERRATEVNTPPHCIAYTLPHVGLLCVTPALPPTSCLALHRPRYTMRLPMLCVPHAIVRHGSRYAAIHVPGIRALANHCINLVTLQAPEFRAESEVVSSIIELYATE